MKQKKPANIQSVLKRLLVKHNITANGLATKLDLPTPTIHRLITGEVKDPRLSTLMFIADYFDMTIEQLIGRELLPKNFFYSVIHLALDKAQSRESKKCT